MSDRRNFKKYEIISTICEGEIIRIVQNLMNECNALKRELNDVRAEVAKEEKKCADAEETIKLLREKLADEKGASVNIIGAIGNANEICAEDAHDSNTDIIPENGEDGDDSHDHNEPA